MSSIAIRRDLAGRFSAKSILKRFAVWLVLLPFRILWSIVLTVYKVLAFILPSRRTAKHILFWQLLFTGWLCFGWALSLHFNIKCSEGGGWFPTKQECGEMAEANLAVQMAPNNVQALETWDVPIDN